MGKIKYIYVDESGDLGAFGSKYFTVVAIVVDDTKTLERIIKKVRQRKLKKSIKQLSEIKANNSNRLIREYILNIVKKSQCQIFAIVVDKEQIAKHLFEIKNELYNYLCGILMQKLNILDGKGIITIDKKYTNTLLREDFNRYITNKLRETNKDLKIEIKHKDSFASNELQVVDFVVWSINRKLNLGDDFYYKIIEEKIVNKEDMFLWKPIK
ncbi:DUF3800 domain-containing protein [Candidatus Pacearchaeota archaeon]|nr:DUF3800 domain-containing protein [Candidatus Pacearchaeota archaeon]